MQDRIEQIKNRLKLCTRMDTKTAEISEDGMFDCPFCEGEYQIEATQFINIDNLPLNVIFSGIGNEFGQNQDFIDNAQSDMQFLLEKIERLQSEKKGGG